MRRGVAVAAALAAALAGCGNAPGDLMKITTSGGGGDAHRIVVTGNGRGSCDGGSEQTLPSDHVLDAREVEREVKTVAEERKSYTDAPSGARRYTVTTKDGLVYWLEGARGTPPVVAKAIVLTQELKRDLCPGAS